VAVDFGAILHGEHSLRLHRPVPSSADCSVATRVVDVIDKSSAALVILQVDIADDRGPLATNIFRLLIRGEGGVGRLVGKVPAPPEPDSPPDAVTRSPVAPNQAFLYRLSGDTNPLHADPEVAAAAGFRQPILHGLCTYGMVALAVVESALDGDVGAVLGFDVRFAGVVYPGETVVSKYWRRGDQIRIAAGTEERGSPVLSQAVITVA
jgi:acyl dehydratase